MKANEFKNLKTVDSTWHLMRGVILVFFVGCLVLVGVVVVYSYQIVENSRNRVYVMDDNKSLMLALSQDHNVNREAEAKDHVRTFVKLLFELEPDEKQIDKSIDEAAYLGNRPSVYRFYTDLKEKNYYNNLISGDIHQKVDLEIKNIVVNVSKSPYYFRARGVQELTRATIVTYRSLLVEGYLIDVTRTDRNSHGMLVEKFKVLENKDIETVNRDPQQASL